MEDELLVRIEESQKEYKAESKTYQEVINFYTTIQQYDNLVLNEVVEDAINWVNKIKESRDNYKDALSAFNSEDYETALAYYMLVIQEDTVYYARAQEESLVAQQNLEEQLEQERLEALKQDAILAANNYSNNSDYDSAIYEIQQALTSLPEDSELLELLSECETLKAEAIEKAKSERVEDEVIVFETYDETYKEGDIDLMIANLQFPKITDDTEAYQLINRDMEQKKQELIEYCDFEAESGRTFCTDDDFYASSLDLSCSVGYNGGGIIAFTFSGYSYLGGMHGIPFYETYMYNLATGQRIGLQDILAISEDDFKQIVTSEFEQLINSGTEYYPEAMDTVKDSEVSTYSYYLAEDGLHIYYDPYVLSYYAMGFVEVVIPYEGIVNFVNP